ncbi:trypsin-1 [Anabrus simplex]|uniref:trypsin-1 n=1 Tax=Anabrus simplex TaxID=316456 RepID=UPI0035A28E12
MGECKWPALLAKKAYIPYLDTMKMLIWILPLYVVVQVVAGAEQNRTSLRFRRSGGYPKFPVPGVVPSLSCGTREITFEPRRSGTPYPKIVGGTAGPYGAYPWQVEIEIWQLTDRQWQHHCGGAVLSDRLVVTAAHCLQDVEPSRLRVVVGDYKLGERDKHEQSFRVERVLVHPNFRRMGPYSNDIGLLKLKSAGDKGITFNSHVRAICLPSPSAVAKEAAGSWCTVTGWGAQEASDPDSLSAELRAAAVPLLDLETCRDNSVYGGRHQSILDSMLCAGLLEGGVDACGGDSGGPLACEVDGRYVLTGVVSWGDGCAKKDRPGVYTRVSHYVEWIEASMKKLGL